MDVERIQKINNLALSLMKQGLAADRDQAVAQAEKIFPTGSTDSYNSIRQTLEQVNSEQQPAPLVQEVKVEETRSELSQDSIRSILEKNTKFIVTQLKEFQEKIRILEKELLQVKTKLAYKNLPTVRQIVSEGVKTPQEVSKTETKEVHPRSGDYAEEDVSIEKFFYMGSR